MDTLEKIKRDINEILFNLEQQNIDVAAKSYTDKHNVEAQFKAVDLLILVLFKANFYKVPPSNRDNVLNDILERRNLIINKFNKLFLNVLPNLDFRIQPEKNRDGR